MHNFNRVGENVRFEITRPMPMLPIHMLVMQESGWDLKTAYTKQNNGMGFAYLFPDRVMGEEAVDMINERGEHRAQIVGEVARHKGKDLVTRLHLPGEKPIEFVGYSN